MFVYSIYLMDVQPKLESLVKIRFYFAQKMVKFECFLNDFIIISFIGFQCI